MHTREGHRPDLGDCPRAKLRRGSPELGIGGARGCLLVEDATEIYFEAFKLATLDGAVRRPARPGLTGGAWLGVRSSSGGLYPGHPGSG